MNSVIRVTYAINQTSCRIGSDSYFYEIYVGNTNAFKCGGPRARSGQFNRIANIIFSKQKVPAT